MKEINCILVEDEIPSSEEFIFILNNYRDFKILKVCRDGKEAMEVILNYCPEVVFLDINIPILNGMELAKKIDELDQNISIVFTTSYEEHALKAFELDAVDYILKPFDEVRIHKTLLKLRNKIKNENKDTDYLTNKLAKLVERIDKEHSLLKRIPCQAPDKIIIINIEDIYYFYIEDDKTYVKTKENSYFTKYTLSELENKTDFFRSHKSYLVNIEKISELSPWFNGTYQLFMGDDENSKIPLSRSYVKRLKNLLNI